MSPKEKKELVSYLKKETDCLTKAIDKAYKNQRVGRVANYEQMRDALLSTLNKIIETKKNLLLFLTAALLLFSSMKEQVKKPEQEKDKLLAGKIFVITISEKFKDAKPFQYRLAFKEGTLYPKALAIKSRQDSLPAGFSPGVYCRTVDSSDAEPTIIFSSLSKKKNGETLLWLGYVSGNKIEGAVHWSGGGKKYKVYSFSGAI